MKIITFFLITGLLILISSCGFQFNTVEGAPDTNEKKDWSQFDNKMDWPKQNNLQGMPSEPGKCYARCLMGDQFEEEIIDSIYFYTGDDLEQEGIEHFSIETAPAKTKWVKKRVDRKCHSSNLDDCLVWCLENTPPDTTQGYLVSDTALVKEWVFDYVYKTTLVEEGGFTEWREVVCSTSPHYKNLVKRVQQALNDFGYDAGPVNNKNNRLTKDALIKFQKVNGLPIGQMDYETLEALDIQL